MHNCHWVTLGNMCFCLVSCNALPLLQVAKCCKKKPLLLAESADALWGKEKQNSLLRSDVPRSPGVATTEVKYFLLQLDLRKIEKSKRKIALGGIFRSLWHTCLSPKWPMAHTLFAQQLYCVGKIFNVCKASLTYNWHLYCQYGVCTCMTLTPVLFVWTPCWVYGTFTQCMVCVTPVLSICHLYWVCVTCSKNMVIVLKVCHLCKYKWFHGMVAILRQVFSSQWPSKALYFLKFFPQTFVGLSCLVVCAKFNFEYTFSKYFCP